MTSTITYPSYIKPRAKSQRRDPYVTIDYAKVRVVGTFRASVGYSLDLQECEAVLAEVDGKLYPCWRRKARGTEITAISQNLGFKACSVADAVE